MTRKKQKPTSKIKDPFMEDKPEPLPKGLKIDPIPEQKPFTNNNAFLRSMFQTFGYTLIGFMVLLLLLFLVKWITS